jgi:hypothetical protein
MRDVLALRYRPVWIKSVSRRNRQIVQTEAVRRSITVDSTRKKVSSTVITVDSDIPLNSTIL